MATYYARLKKLWDELNNYEKIPICECKGITAELMKIYENEKWHQFLMGLDGSIFKTIRKNTLNEDPLPNVNHAYSKIIREEKLLSMAKEEDKQNEWLMPLR